MRSCKVWSRNLVSIVETITFIAVIERNAGALPYRGANRDLTQSQERW